MKAFLRHALKPLLVLLVSASVVFAQTPPAPRKAAATQQELDQMLAPIALYPDSLLSQILMASTYPLEVVEAARWSRANPGLKGEEAVNAVEQRDWDVSVKSLAAFPQVLAMMDQQLEWTSRLGDVFIAQEPQGMEKVQSLRQKAYDAGNLRSTEQAHVVQQGDAIAIEPAAPPDVDVPDYDPRVADGTRWWPEDPAPATRNSSLNRPEVHSANPRPQMQGIERPYPRRDGRPDGRSSTNPGAAARPEIRAPMTRPPVAAAPQVHAGPGNVPRMQNPAPQFGAGRGQAANRSGPSAPRAPGEGHSR